MKIVQLEEVSSMHRRSQKIFWGFIFIIVICASLTVSAYSDENIINVYEFVPVSIDSVSFLNTCLSENVSIEFHDALIDGEKIEQFEAQIEDKHYQGYTSGNTISFYETGTTTSEKALLEEKEILKRCDDIVKQLNWGKVELKECILKKDEYGSFYSILYEYVVDDIPILGDRGLTFRGVLGRDGTKGEFIHIEYDFAIRSIEASSIRMVSETVDSVEVMSETEAESAAEMYFNILKQSGIETNQMRQDMQLIYIPYPKDDYEDILIPAWEMNSINDQGDRYVTLIDAVTGYVYLNGL